MSITAVLQKSGQWTIGFKDSMPLETMNAIDYFEHFAFIPGRVDVKGMGDQLLDIARYVGIVRNKNDTSVGGIDMSGWLGDESQKGAIYETAVILNASTFADAMRALLPEAVHEGTFHSVPGTFTDTILYQDPRTAIDYVATTFKASWRVNNDATLDAGLASDLYVTDPKAIIVSKNWGADLNLLALQGNIDPNIDAKNYVTRVLLMGQGSGLSMAVGSADNPEVDYLDMYGNPVQRTQMVSMSTSSPTNVNVQAQVALNTNSAPIRSLTMDTEEYDISGDFHVGDMVWVFDPASGLYDQSNPVPFRGQTLYPTKIQCIQLTIPVLDGYTVAWRDKHGTWTDLSEYYQPETGATNVEVADSYSTLLVNGSEAVQPRLSADTMPPASPHITSVLTASYLAGNGLVKARLTISWNTPLNQDGSTVTDGNYYTVRYRVHGATSYQYQSVAWGTNVTTIGDLSNGTDYDVSIEAVDLSINRSGYDTDGVYTAQPDVTPPSTPAAPSVAGNTLSIQVSHNLGKASGGTFNLENDLEFLFIYAGTTSGFTPSSANFVGRIPCGNGNLELSIPAIGSFQVVNGATKFVKVTAVDSSGNESLPSTSSNTTALLVDTANITNLAVTNAKIADMSATKITAGTIGAYEIILSTGGAIHSNGFVSGSVGWEITGAGNAEFYNATVRGAFESGNPTGSHIEINGGTYNGWAEIGFFTGSVNQVQEGYIWVWQRLTGAADSWVLELKAPTTQGAVGFASSPYIQMAGKSHDSSSLSYLLLGSDPDTLLSLHQSDGVFLQTYANQFLAMQNPGSTTLQREVGQYIDLELDPGFFSIVQGPGGGGFASFQCRQSIGFTDARFAGIPPSSTDALMRWSTSSGQIWYDSSSARFKHDIRDIEDVYDLDLIDKIRAVAYRENDKTTGDEKPHHYIGLVAEEIAEVIPALVVNDHEDNPLSVHYDKTSVLTLAAVQDLRRRVAALEGSVIPKRPKVRRSYATAGTKESGEDFRLPIPKRESQVKRPDRAIHEQT